MRIISFNVWHGRLPRAGSLWLQSIEPRGQRARRFEALVTLLRSLDADVLALQECLPQPAFSHALARRLERRIGDYDVLTAVANAGVRWGRVGLPIGIGTGEGVTLLAKRGLRLTPAGEHTLSGGGVANGRWSAHLTQRSVVLAATIQPPGGPRVGLMCTHLRYTFATIEGVRRAWERLRADGHVTGEPSRQLIDEITADMAARDAALDALGPLVRRFRHSVDRLVVAGDFNLDHDAPQLVAWAKRLGLRNALRPNAAAPDYTWDPRINPHCGSSASMKHPEGAPKRGVALLHAAHDTQPQTPDHIFVGPRCNVAAAQVVGDRPVDGLLASDHLGVMADVT